MKKQKKMSLPERLLAYSIGSVLVYLPVKLGSITEYSPHVLFLVFVVFCILLLEKVKGNIISRLWSFIFGGSPAAVYLKIGIAMSLYIILLVFLAIKVENKLDKEEISKKKYILIEKTTRRKEELRKCPILKKVIYNSFKDKIITGAEFKKILKSSEECKDIIKENTDELKQIIEQEILEEKVDITKPNDKDSNRSPILKAENTIHVPRDKMIHIILPENMRIKSAETASSSPHFEERTRKIINLNTISFYPEWHDVGSILLYTTDKRNTIESRIPFNVFCHSESYIKKNCHESKEKHTICEDESGHDFILSSLYVYKSPIEKKD